MTTTAAPAPPSISSPKPAAEMARGLAPLKRLRALYRPDRSDIMAVVVFSVVNGLLLLATPVAVQALVNFVAFGAAVPSIAILAILLFVSLAAAALVVALQTWIVELLQRRVFVRLVVDLAERLPRLSWKVRDRYYEPELVNRFFDVVTIQKMSATLLLDGLANLLSVIVGLSILAFYHPVLLAFDGVLLLGITLVFLVPVRKGTRTAMAESAAKYEVAGWLEEIARHPLTFKSPGSENYVRLRSEDFADSYVRARRTHYRVVFGQIVASLLLQVLASTALLGLGGWLVVIGELTLGQLVAAELLVVLVVQSVAKLGRLAEKYYDILAATDKVGKLIDLEVEDGHAPGQAAGESGRPASVRVRGLELPALPGTKVCEAIDFSVEPGEIVGIVGPHGIGKSLLLEVLYRLREPKVGTVLVDETHFGDLDLTGYRSEVAMAANAEPLQTSIFDNVSLGRIGIGVHEVHQALAAVGLLSEVQALPQGLQTTLNPTGAPLSSGQRSRLMLARAIAGSPRVLLIDGLLDDLSAAGTQAVMDGVLAARDRWSIVIVSERADILEKCDRQVLLQASEKEGGNA